MSRVFKTLVSLGMATAIVGCAGPGHVSGGGPIHSLGGDHQAVVQFEANSCDGIENSKGHIHMKDKAAIDWEDIGGIHFTGTVDSTYFCSLDNDDPNAPLCNCGEGYQEINFTYDSKNNKARGTGIGAACVADIGDGKKQGRSGIAEIQLLTGPFAGYHNVGATKVTQHSCDAE